MAPLVNLRSVADDMVNWSESSGTGKSDEDS